nr:VCBS repeat-containing protein [Chitinophagaceae bacterium]
ADYDNDGWKDLMVTNGYLRDYTDNDFLKYTVADEQLAQAAKGNLQFKTYDLVKKMPSNKLRNYFFRNEGNLRFSDRSQEWGFVQPTISNCAAYADFDNDGDLDLIIGNNNEPVQLLENLQRNSGGSHYLQVQLLGANWNTQAMGACVTIFTSGRQQTREQYPVRGYQSSVTQVLHFGLGDAGIVDSVQVVWPGGSTQVIKDVKTDSRILCKQTEGNILPVPGKTSPPVFRDVTSQSGLDFRHQENEFIDFKVEVLLPYQLSKMGPALATADVNADGLDDIFLGGAIGQTGVLYLQQREGGFRKAQSQPWEADKESEDVRSLFADFNNDKHPDLYVVSGGNEYEQGSPEFADRLYLNDGKGKFTKATGALPADMLGSKMAIAAADIDADGDLDLFIGGSAIPGAFPNAGRSFLLRNDINTGTMRFTDVTASWNAQLLQPGIVNAAVFADLNKDKRPDLLLAGEWMPLRLFEHTGTSFRETPATTGLTDHGLWSALLVEDVNADGLPDIIAGNAGNNLQFKASEKEPITLFASDIDDNGVDDVLFCYYINGKSYPAASRDELLDQVVPLRKRFVKYQQYANATVEDIVPAAKRKTAAIWKVTELSSVIYLNKGNGFEKTLLPPEAQFSRVFSIQVLPASGGERPLLLTGNFYPWRVQWGRCDGGLGTLLQTDAKGVTRVVPNMAAGLFASGDIRQAGLVKTAAGKHWVILAKNNDSVQVLEIQ